MRADFPVGERDFFASLPLEGKAVFARAVSPSSIDMQNLSSDARGLSPFKRGRFFFGFLKK
ncbi:MAG: hypothetical protein DBX55_02295 [Verrucomicrobia bacterium]|nr:MAG: hypothetical protein DBX55_02295 [Verrucomicrobiota bacterium]